MKRIIREERSFTKPVGPSLPQISLLKQSLEMQLSQSQSSLQQLQHQFSQEREHLRMQLDELQTEHKRRQQHLQETHHCALQDLEHVRQHDLKVGGGASRASSPGKNGDLSYVIVRMAFHRVHHSVLLMPLPGDARSLNWKVWLLYDTLSV